MFTSTHQQLDDLTLGDKSRVELRTMLKQLHGLETHAAERRLAVLAELESLDDGGLDAASEARTITRASARGAKRDAATAEALSQLPAAAHSLAAGQITLEHAERLAAAARETSPDEAHELVAIAEQVPADLFAKRANTWLGARRSREATEDRHQRQRADRELMTWNEDGPSGSLLLHGQMDNATGRDFEQALQTKVDELWRADGGRDGSPDEVRSPAQRRLDALVELVLRPGAEVSGLRPITHMVHLVVTAETGDAEFLDGEPVPHAYLEHLDPETAQIVGHVLDGKGRPLFLGRRRRLASVDQWLHLIVRDRGCTDCGADPALTEAHHDDPWTPTGLTDVDNLELKCHTDHGLAHQKGSKGARAVRSDGSARAPTRRRHAA